MFISAVNTKIKENDIVVLSEELKFDFGFYTKGHEFKVISECKNQYGYTAYNVVDLENDKIYIEISHALLYKKLDFFKAKEIRKNQIDFHKNLKLMKKQCKFAYEGIEDREYITKCKKKPHWAECYPEMKCNPQFWKKIKLNKILK
jgi:hypothetical protein